MKAKIMLLLFFIQTCATALADSHLCPCETLGPCKNLTAVCYLGERDNEHYYFNHGRFMCESKKRLSHVKHCQHTPCLFNPPEKIAVHCQVKNMSYEALRLKWRRAMQRIMHFAAPSLY